MRTHYKGWEIIVTDYAAIARKGGIVLEKRSSPKMDVPLLPAIKNAIDWYERRGLGVGS